MKFNSYIFKIHTKKEIYEKFKKFISKLVWRGTLFLNITKSNELLLVETLWSQTSPNVCFFSKMLWRKIRKEQNKIKEKKSVWEVEFLGKCITKRLEQLADVNLLIH